MSIVPHRSHRFESASSPAVRMVGIVAACAVASTIAACGVIPYVPPAESDSEVATMRFMGPSSQGLFQRGGIEVRILDADSCFGRLASPLAHSLNTTSTVQLRVPANGKPVRARLAWAGNNFGTTSQCSFPVQFVPAAGAHYEMEVSISGQRCYMSLVRVIRQGPGQTVRKPQASMPICGSTARQGG